MDVTLPGDGVKLGATRWPGHGTPIVLLHGLASQRRFWNLVVPHLVGQPLLALDQRGHGDSDRPPTGYEPERCAADVATAMDALGWSRAVLVGCLQLQAPGVLPGQLPAGHGVDGQLLEGEVAPRRSNPRGLQQA